MFAPLAVGTWRLLSGFEHGFSWALLKGSDRTIESNIPGGMSTRLVMNDDEFVNASKMTYFLLLGAMNHLMRRHHES